MSNLVKQLQKENNQIEKLISEENNEVLTDMIVYIRSSNLKDYDIEIIRKELYGMVIEAQYRGQSLNEVFGENYKEFCDELMGSGREKNIYEKILEVAHILVIGIGVLFTYEFIITGVLLRGLQGKPFTMPITLGFLVATVLAHIFAYIIFRYVSNKSFELSKRNYMLAFLVTGRFAVLIGFRFILDDIVLFFVNGLYSVAAFVIAYSLVRFLEERESYKLVKKSE